MAVHAVPLYHARINNQDKTYIDRFDGNGFYHTYDRFSGKMKYGADVFGLISRTCRFATPLLDGRAAEWTTHVAGYTGAARTGLSIPYELSVVNKLSNKFEARNALELCSSGLFAGSIFTLDRAVGSSLSGWGSAFKTGVDVLDLKSSVDKFSNFKKLSDEAERMEEVTPQVREGLKAELWENAFKVARFALSIFSGSLTILAFVFQVAVAKSVLVAGAAAAVGSIIFSMAAEWQHESARIIPAPREWADAHFPPRAAIVLEPVALEVKQVAG